MSYKGDIFEIGKVIYHVLTSDETVKSYLGNKVYPLIADKGTTLPFIIYRRSSLTPADTKEGIYVTSASLSLSIVAEKYDTSTDIVKAVTKALISTKGVVEGFNIIRITLVPGSPNEYWDNAFVQELTFKIDIDDE